MFMESHLIQNSVKPEDREVAEQKTLKLLTFMNLSLLTIDISVSM